jgi:RNA polymerase sigma-70 factor (ECF subfamily)
VVGEGGLREEQVTEGGGKGVSMNGQRRQQVEGSETGTLMLDVAAAVRGDADAVQRVWMENRRWVAAVILAHKPREAELDDLLQDVAMTFVRTIGKLRDQATLKPWLRTVAINAARAAGRTTKRRRRVLGPRVEDAPPEAVAGGMRGSLGGADEAVEQVEQTGRLTKLAAKLPEGYREPLILKCVRGMSYRQIGELMGLPETTIETRIARGRRMLRELASGGEVRAGETGQEGAR